MVEPTPAPPHCDRLGTLDHGLVASLIDGSVVEMLGSRIRWWIRADDRWHDPQVSASRRVRRVDGVPVIETTIRIPSGDVHATVCSTVWSGSDGAHPEPVVVVQFSNPTANPIAIAFVVESAGSLTVDDYGIDDGAVELRTGRPARATASDRTVAALFEAIDANDPAERHAGSVAAGAAAVVLPVPHLSQATAVVARSASLELDANAVAAIASQIGPGAERIVSGWGAMLERAPRLDWTDPAQSWCWTAAVSDALLGPSDPSDPGLDTMAWVIHMARLGLLDECDDAMEQILASQRGSGAIAGADPVRSSARLLDVTAAFWSGGLERSVAERLLIPVAGVIGWLTARRRRSAVEASAAEVARGYACVVPFLTALDQPELAEELARAAGELGWRGPAEPQHAWGVSASASVSDQLDAAVAETASGIDLGRGWSPARSGQSVAVHDVPTRWGSVSWALRWHGVRPALLWELTPWPDRAVDVAPRWRASSIDPDWTGSGRAGEALLQAPSLPVPDSGGFS